MRGGLEHTYRAQKSTWISSHRWGGNWVANFLDQSGTAVRKFMDLRTASWGNRDPLPAETGVGQRSHTKIRLVIAHIPGPNSTKIGVGGRGKKISGLVSQRSQEPPRKKFVWIQEQQVEKNGTHYQLKLAVNISPRQDAAKKGLSRERFCHGSGWFPLTVRTIWLNIFIWKRDA